MMILGNTVTLCVCVLKQPGNGAGSWVRSVTLYVIGAFGFGFENICEIVLFGTVVAAKNTSSAEPSNHCQVYSVPVTWLNWKVAL